MINPTFNGVLGFLLDLGLLPTVWQQAKVAILMACLLLAVSAMKFLDDFYGADFYVEQIKSILDFSTNENNYERKLQFDVLLDRF